MISITIIIFITIILLFYFNASNINYNSGADWLSLRSMSQ